MTNNPEADAADRHLQSPREDAAGAELIMERRFEKCGCASPPRDRTPLHPIGTRFVAIIGWW